MGKRLLKAMAPASCGRWPTATRWASSSLQFCLILIYPAWLVGVLASALMYFSVYGVFWVLFAPDSVVD